MPVTISAEKKLRQDKKRAKQNDAVKRAVKEAIKSYLKKPTPTLLSKVFSLLDRARKKNVVHKNKVARLKSRLSKKLTGKPAPKIAKVKPTVKKKSSPKKSAKKSTKA